MGKSAANLWDFKNALQVLPDESLSYHMQRGDFERWFRDVLNDTELARRMGKIAHRELSNDQLREALSEIVESRYEELETLA